MLSFTVLNIASNFFLDYFKDYITISCYQASMYIGIKNIFVLYDYCYFCFLIDIFDEINRNFNVFRLF